ARIISGARPRAGVLFSVQSKGMPLNTGIWKHPRGERFGCCPLRINSGERLSVSVRRIPQCLRRGMQPSEQA
ncbi:MAG: hypothetical protein QG615_444, partial [Nitrospirota bacterium]|nr:hypothetical protein [Nitrospirota bacterium]